MDEEYFREQLEPFISLLLPKIRQIAAYYPEKRSIEVSFRDLQRYDVDLAAATLENPDLAIETAEKIIAEYELRSPTGQKVKLHFRITDIPDNGILIEQIGAQFINRLFAFKALVTRRGDVLNKVKLLTLECDHCKEVFRIYLKPETQIAKRCPVCRKGLLQTKFSESEFTDIQIIELQDLLERLLPGSPSAKIVAILEDDLVNTIVPGDVVEIVGILRINPEGKRGRKYVFPKFVDVVHIHKVKREFEELEITPNDEEKIRKIASLPNVEEIIYQSIAPDIFGYEEIKHAIALQLMGGTKDKKTASGQPIRDNIHILLIGDPGIAKTRFLQQVVRIAPKSIFVSGKSVSGVGLTASVEKDELSGGGWTLKAGALVLASGGIAAIDEFDKIDDEDRASLHEVMESGTVSIAKAGIVARFKAKTSIIAAANPKFGRFQHNRNLAEQFNIPPSLLSRFDLIFPIMDVLDLEKDERLAEHILQMHAETLEIKETVLDIEFLRKYIAYAKKHVEPRLTKGAMDKIKEYYLQLRALGQKTGTVPITPRYLEGLVRLAEANAKLRLSNKVTAHDAEQAIKLMDFMMRSIMTDPETGKIDADMVETGKSKSKMQKLSDIEALVGQLAKMYDKVEIELVKKEAEEKLGIPPEETERLLEQLLKDGILMKPYPGYVRPTDMD